ncbi:cobyrinate a,c-diamide synthase [uncultured Oxalicibacterium sp.]|uniref:cobyrinate a,c-diamide synthase n=1 Tax=uncultured Oxalicibacterium sp. TaxID=1168540 RepID=UPI0025E10695|nr:cobyrinate a,c-diamide synthase [uncultured Oxalicibacterium sp.]
MVLVAGMASGQGKTTVTAALARRLMREGLRVRVFKTGPDYLDPMILQRACGSEVYALDLWMVGLDACKRLLAEAAQEADVVLIEGVMGLYDGDPSSADLAQAFGVPVVTVIDAGKMAATVGAVVHGLQHYGPVQLAGVILNRIASTSHRAQIEPALRDVPLLAHLPKLAESLPERHLGLVQPDEVAKLDEILDRLADRIELDMHAWQAMPSVHIDRIPAAEPLPQKLAGRRIAVARDAAFAFVYHANLACLRALGAEVVFFSPLNDEPLPEGTDGVYIPGGYPELHCATLAEAKRWQASMRTAHAQQVPILAECGGMMAMTESITDAQGKTWPMAGLLPGRITMHPKLAGLGMQWLTTDEGELRGHAFHYSTLQTTLPSIAQTVTRTKGKTGESLYRHGSLTATYFHAYFASCPAATARLFFRQDSQQEKS